jgi:hypothetical protein
MLKGLLASGITLGVAAAFPEPLVFPFFAAVLGLTAGVYPGMAMADPRGGRRGVEWVAAVLVVGGGLVGLWVSPLLLAGAWGLHALVDLAHRFTSLGDGLPEGVAGSFLAFDLVVGGFVVYMWAVGPA